MSRVITAAVVASLVFAGHAASAQPVPIPVLPPMPVLPQTFVLPPVPPLPVLPEMPTLPELPPMPPVPVAPLSPMPPMPPLAALPPLPPGPYFDFNDFDAGFLYQPAPKPQPTPRPEPPPRTGRVVIERNAEGAYEQARQLIDSGRYERALESLDRVAAAPRSGDDPRSADDRVGAGTAVATISHSLWQGRFGGAPDTIGKTIALESVPYTIVGVAQPGFSGVEVGKQTDIWVPLESERLIRRPSRTASTASKWVQMIGRVKPGY